MASVKEILEKEDASLHTIVLHHEGIFYKAYNESCFLFHKFITPYQVNQKYCKKEHHMMYSLGFPQSSLADILEKAGQQEVQGYPDSINIDATQIDGFAQLSESDYAEWMSQCGSGIVTPTYYNAASLAERLLSLELQNATPMECMNLINQLQIEIRNGSSS